MRQFDWFSLDFVVVVLFSLNDNERVAAFVNILPLASFAQIEYRTMQAEKEQTANGLLAVVAYAMRMNAPRHPGRRSGKQCVRMRRCVGLIGLCLGLPKLGSASFLVVAAAVIVCATDHEIAALQSLDWTRTVGTDTTLRRHPLLCLISFLLPGHDFCIAPRNCSNFSVVLFLRFCLCLQLSAVLRPPRAATRAEFHARPRT